MNKSKSFILHRKIPVLREKKLKDKHSMKKHTGSKTTPLIENFWGYKKAVMG